VIEQRVIPEDLVVPVAELNATAGGSLFFAAESARSATKPGGSFAAALEKVYAHWQLSIG
jgi:hypothetical protein